jgi:hypothetical protein
MYQRGSFLLPALVSLTIISFSLVVIIYTQNASASQAWKDSANITSTVITQGGGDYLDEELGSAPTKLVNSIGTFSVFKHEEAGEDGVAYNLEIINEPNPLLNSSISVNQIILFTAEKEKEEVLGFTKPIYLEQQFSDQDLVYLRKETLSFYRYNTFASTWESISSVVDYSNQMVKAMVEEVGIYSLRAKPAKPAPQIESVDPTSIILGETVWMEVKGKNFLPKALVRIEGVEMKTEYVSSGELKIRLEGDYLLPGSAELEIMNEDGQTVRFEKPIKVLL